MVFHIHHIIIFRQKLMQLAETLRRIMMVMLEPFTLHNSEEIKPKLLKPTIFKIIILGINALVFNFE